jgi:hypothetical protein
MWVNEWPQTFNGDPATAAVTDKLNHLTMMVWKDVTAVGCAWKTGCNATAPMTDRILMSCE